MLTKNEFLVETMQDFFCKQAGADHGFAGIAFQAINYNDKLVAAKAGDHIAGPGDRRNRVAT